jgi:F-type H+/Na+-transporting ATPase subunit alpha
MIFAPLEDALARVKPALETAEIAHIVSVGNGVAEVAGFTDLRADELLTFAGGVMGIASNLSEDRAGVIVLGATEACARATRSAARAGSSMCRWARADRPGGGWARPPARRGSPIEAQEFCPSSSPRRPSCTARRCRCRCRPGSRLSMPRSPSAAGSAS